MNPVIGITTSLEEKNTRNSLSMDYIYSTQMAGGIPVALPVLNDDTCIEGYLDILDGLLFSGGGDITPCYFGENPVRELKAISSRRDDFEFNLFKKAYSRNMPILGICRGAQVINTALGGTLYQDISSQKKDSFVHNPNGIGKDELYHSINLRSDSMLYEIFE